jgi:hypothetical protein
VVFFLLQVSLHERLLLSASAPTLSFFFLVFFMSLVLIFLVYVPRSCAWIPTLWRPKQAFVSFLAFLAWLALFGFFGYTNWSAQSAQPLFFQFFWAPSSVGL